MRKRKAAKFIFLLLLTLLCVVAFSACARPAAPSAPSEPTERSAPYEGVSEFLEAGVQYPDLSTPLKPGLDTYKVYDTLYYECEDLLNADESKGITLEQMIADGKLIKHPIAGFVFGRIDNDVPRVKKQLILTAADKGTVTTGLYAAAGETITLETADGFAGSLGITVAPSMADIDYGKDLSRFPKVRRQFKTSGAVTKFGTPFGGLITLNISAPPQEPVLVTISGAVETPHYVLGKTTQAEWDMNKNFKGLSAHFVAGRTQFICPADLVKDIKSPQAALEFWNGLSGYFDGIVPSGGGTESLVLFDVYVPDAPYYFASERAAAALDITQIIKGGAWDILSELANNTALPAWADKSGPGFMLALRAALDNTMAGALELIEPLKGTDRFSSYSYAVNTAKSINSEHDYSELTFDARQSMYAILAHRFGFDGVKAMLNMPDGGGVFKSEQERRDGILTHFSKALGYDMRMFFDYFKFDNSFAAKDTVAKMNLPVFYPAAAEYAGKSYIVTAGESYRLDVILTSLYGDVTLESVKGAKGAFTKTDKHTFVFTPVSTDKKAAGILTVTVKTPSETVRLKSGFYTSGNESALPAAFSKTKPEYVFVVPVTIYYALFSSLGAGALAGIAFALAAYKRKSKKKPEQENIK